MCNSIQRLCSVMLLVGASAAHAELVIWEFEGVTFDDDAIAQGQFTVDTDLKSVTDFDIFTSAGKPSAGTALLTPFEYNALTAQVTQQTIEFDNGQGFFFQLDSLAGVVPGATRELHLSFSGPLVPTGPASIVSDGTLGRVSYELLLSGQMAPQRVVKETGQLKAIPEPAQVLCFALGLAMAGVVVLNRARSKPASAPSRS